MLKTLDHDSDDFFERMQVLYVNPIESQLTHVDVMAAQFRLKNSK